MATPKSGKLECEGACIRFHDGREACRSDGEGWLTADAVEVLKSLGIARRAGGCVEVRAPALRSRLSPCFSFIKRAVSAIPGAYKDFITQAMQEVPGFTCRTLAACLRIEYRAKLGLRPTPSIVARVLLGEDYLTDVLASALCLIMEEDSQLMDEAVKLFREAFKV